MNQRGFGLIVVWVSLVLIGSNGFAGERFTDNQDGTLTDHVLNVMWAKADNQGNISQSQGEKWVKYTFPDTMPKLYTNWRLPTLDELRSLYVRDASYKGYEADCGQRVRIIPQIRLSCGWVWTSEKKAISAYVFNFNKGYHYTDRMVHDRGYRVLPVRSLE